MDELPRAEASQKDQPEGVCLQMTGYNLTEDEIRQVFPGSRIRLEVRQGIQIYRGRCEGCRTSNRIVWDGSLKRYLCAKCLEVKDTPTEGHAFRTSKSEPYPIAVNG